MIRKRAPYFLAGMVAIATLALYIPALRNQFVNWDDDVYVFDNIHVWSLDWSLIKWAFSDLSLGFWHPTTWISHAVDYAFWGLNPFGHHLTSILLHAINTFIVVLLVIRLLEVARISLVSRATPSTGEEGRMGKNALITAGATGLLFGLHPLHVESVAWVAERKDLLCALFFLLSILAYINYAESVRKPGGDPAGLTAKWFSNRQYLIALALFILALSSKSMAVSLPAVLLILDWYPLRRIPSLRCFKAVFIEKIPFIAMSLIFSVVSILAQNAIGALSFMTTVPFPKRALVAFRAIVLYIWKMLLPHDLLALYPYPTDISFLSAEYLFAVALTAVITAACIYAARRQPLLPAVWAYYLIVLLPVLGFIQVGRHPMADRFTYLPSLGPFLLAGLLSARVWAGADALRRGRTPMKSLAASVAVFIFFSMASITLKQIAIWKNSITLWGHVIGKEPGRVPAAYINRGVMFAETNQMHLALDDFNAAINLDPSALGYNNRGKAVKAMGQIEQAVADYTSAINLDPAYHLAYNNRGIAYKEMGRSENAIEDFSAAIKVKPDYAPAYTNRGVVYGELGQLDRALADFTAAIMVNPFYSDAYVGRGLIFEKRGEFGRAVADYDRAITLSPFSADAYLNRGVVFERMNILDRAVLDYGKAIELKPDDYLAYRNRGAVFARLGKTEQASIDHQKACDLGDPEGCFDALLPEGAVAAPQR